MAFLYWRRLAGASSRLEINHECGRLFRTATCGGVHFLNSSAFEDEPARHFMGCFAALDQKRVVVSRLVVYEPRGISIAGKGEPGTSARHGR